MKRPATAPSFLLAAVSSLALLTPARAEPDLSRLQDALRAPGGMNALFDGGAVPAATVAAAPAPGDEIAKALASYDSYAILGLSDAALAAASSDQKILLLRTVTSRAGQQNNQDDNGYKDACEQFVLRLLGGVKDDAAFDRIYYHARPSELKNTFDAKAIKALVARHQAGAAPGDWNGLGSYVDTVADTKSSGKNFVEVLIDGPSVIGPAMTALEGAKSSIHIEVFQLQGDDFGWAVGRALAAKAQAGVSVRLMVDEQGSDAEHDPEVKKLLDFVRASGAQVIVGEGPFDKSHLDHRKVMVIDGDTAFTGGMNIGKLYQQDWHDQQTLVSGPAVAALQDAFLERWTNYGGKIPTAELPALYPPLSEDAAGATVRVVRHKGGDADENIKAMYLRAIGTAQTSIRIANPYFMDPDVIAALIKAAGRRVKVQVVLPQDNDMAIVQRGSRAYYPDLIKSGVEVWEYQGRMAHEKVAVIDEAWATVGSSNLDTRSLSNNDELNLMITDQTVARYIGRWLFDEDLKKCVRITSYTPTLRERLDRLIGDQL